MTNGHTLTSPVRKFTRTNLMEIGQSRDLLPRKWTKRLFQCLLDRIRGILGMLGTTQTLWILVVHLGNHARSYHQVLSV